MKLLYYVRNLDYVEALFLQYYVERRLKNAKVLEEFEASLRWDKP